jgi:hypothetical protein
MSTRIIKSGIYLIGLVCAISFLSLFSEHTQPSQAADANAVCVAFSVSPSINTGNIVLPTGQTSMNMTATLTYTDPDESDDDFVEEYYLVFKHSDGSYRRSPFAFQALNGFNVRGAASVTLDKQGSWIVQVEYRPEAGNAIKMQPQNNDAVSAGCPAAGPGGDQYADNGRAFMLTSSSVQPLKCDNISFNPTIFGLVLPRSTNYSTTVVVREISLRGPANVDASKYRIRFISPSGVVTIRNVIWNTPTKITDSDYLYQGSTSVGISEAGNWKYMVIGENDAFVHPVNIDAGTRGCPVNSISNTFTVVKEVGGTLPDVIIGPCVDLPEAERVNRYTCNESAADVIFDGCQTGFKPDPMCDAGRFSSIGTGSGPAISCRACVAANLSYGVQQHLQSCDPGNNGTTTLDENKRCDRLKDLKCVSTPGGNGICIFDSEKLDEGQSCYIGADECKRGEDLREADLTCQRGSSNDPTGLIGSCRPVASCGSDNDCVRQMGDNFAKCNTITNRCYIDYTGGGSGSAGNISFGVFNCPNVVLINPSTGGAAVDARGNYISCRGAASADAKCMIDPRLSAAGEEWQIANSCVQCITAGNTWTDSIGCVNTTPSGLFISLLRIILGVIGGVTLIRLILLGYQYNFGQKKEIKASVQDILATLGGLLLVLFSVVLLRIIGVNILDVVPPGFFGT